MGGKISLVGNKYDLLTVVNEALERMLTEKSKSRAGMRKPT